MVSRSLSSLCALAFMLLGIQRAVAAGGSNVDQKWVEMHGWLMWASMGFLFPLGIILIRYTKPQSDHYTTPSAKRVWVLFYLHVFVQVFAVLLSTSGIVILIVKVGPGFDYTHQRLGLAIMIIVWLQPFIGTIRPQRGTSVRPYWYSLHWAFGTGALFLGVIDTFIGIRAYEKIFQTSVRSLNIAFAIQISFMCLLYLLQDRWSYVVGQGRMHKPVPQSMSL